MKHSLDIHIVCNIQTIIDAIKDKVPAKLDAKIWADQYTVNEGTDEDGDKTIDIRVRFNESVDRQVTLDWMKTKAQQVAGNVLTGSYVGYHACPHDETGPCPPSTIFWSK